MTHPLIPALRATYDTLATEAKRHAPGGVLTEADKHGLTRRAAQAHGITPEDAAKWINDRGRNDG